MFKYFLLLTTFLTTPPPNKQHHHLLASASSPTDNTGLRDGQGRVIFAPGLKSLTLSDFLGKIPTPRQRYLKRLQAGLQAEKQVRQSYQERHRAMCEQDQQEQDAWANSSGGEYEDATLAHDEDYKTRTVKKYASFFEEMEDACSEAFNTAYEGVKVEDDMPPLNPKRKASPYQFVGVIDSSKQTSSSVDSSSDGNSSSSSSPPSKVLSSPHVKWYARKKPKHATWTLRLVHVDRPAIFHDLYLKNKFDVYGTYRSTGRDTTTGKSLVQPLYTVRPRSLLTLWNVNPFHFFTNRSGNNSRDRRLPEGLYTDGEKLFESSYDYKFGRVGMKPLGMDLKGFLRSEDGKRMVDERMRMDLERRLTAGAADLVTEF